VEAFLSEPTRFRLRGVTITLQSKRMQTPQRSGRQERLEVFLGKWHTEGLSFRAGQRGENPKA
jgi:hypothetical protein